MSGTLYVVGLPIGNVQDISLRALRILRTVAVVAAENPQETQALLMAHDIDVPLTTYNHTVQVEKAALLLHRLQEGQDVALVADEGTPTICDPGTYLISKAREAEIPTVPIPGASALLAAFSISGFSGDSFIFAGNLPAGRGTRLRILRSFQSQERPVIFFLKAAHLATVLAELQQLCGDRRVLLACDITTPEEYFFQGRIADAIKTSQGGRFTGKLTLVLGKRTGRIGQTSVTKKKRLNTRFFSGSSRGRTGRRAPD